MAGDWMPGGRSGIINMSRVWIQFLTTYTARVGVPQAEIDDLTARTNTAEAYLEIAKSAERTKVNTAQCNAAFEALISAMRTMKRVRFHTPPLRADDYTALLLSLDGTKTPIPVPTGEPIGDLSFPGIHLVQLGHIHCYAGTEPDKKWGYGERIYWILSGTPNDKYPYRAEGEPKKGQVLPYSQFTRRKKELFDFDGESGNRVYFILRYEKSSGEAGPFGPMFSAVIP